MLSFLFRPFLSFFSSSICHLAVGEEKGKEEEMTIKQEERASRGPGCGDSRRIDRPVC